MWDFEIVFYDKPDGSEPAKEFLLSVDVKMRARILRIIDLLANNGTELRMPYSQHLTDGIFEIRAKSGSDISRVLYFFIIGKRIVLTNGFIKKTQKTPKIEIELAKNIAMNFLTGGEIYMTDYRDFLKEQLKDENFKKEYDALEPEFSIVQAMIDARKKSGFTQKELADITGIAQGDISKLENGNANPSLKTLQRLAEGMGMKLKLEFIPIQN